MSLATLHPCMLASAAMAEERPAPVNPKATAEARRLLDVLHEIQGKHTIAGHHDLAKLARGKPIVIGECAPPPTLETLASQPRWAWYMPWGNLVFWGNGPERTKALLADERILTRESVTRGEDGVYRIKR